MLLRVFLSASCVSAIAAEVETFCDPSLEDSAMACSLEPSRSDWTDGGLPSDGLTETDQAGNPDQGLLAAAKGEE